MADLPELNEWIEGIYQLETSDPVLGGPEGIDNLQGKQLASRTKWLKGVIDKIIDGTTSIGKAARLETARAVKFKGAATGSGDFDGSADIDITLALANSGVVAGTFDKVTVNAKGLVTGGSNTPVVAVSASRTLTSDELGLVLIDSSAAPLTIQLPPANSALGVCDVIVRRADNSGNRLVVKAGGTDKIKFHTHLRTEGYSFFVLMGAGDYWHLRSDGAGNWFPISRCDSTPLGRPVFETTTAFFPGGWGSINSWVYNRVEWPWLWDHAQQSGMLTTEAARVGMEGGWTSGDGVSTFRSPEARAEFFRVLDENRGVDVSRVAGSWATDLIRAHSHNIDSPSNPTGLGTGKIARGNRSDISGFPGSELYGGVETRPRSIAYPGRLKLI